MIIANTKSLDNFMEIEYILTDQQKFEINAKIIIRQVYVFYIDDKRRCSWKADVTKGEYKTRKEAEIEKEKIDKQLETQTYIEIGKVQYECRHLVTSNVEVQNVHILEIDGRFFKRFDNLISDYTLQKYFLTKNIHRRFGPTLTNLEEKCYPDQSDIDWDVPVCQNDSV